jgi:hypothetical protein
MRTSALVPGLPRTGTLSALCEKEVERLKADKGAEFVFCAVGLSYTARREPADTPYTQVGGIASIFSLPPSCRCCCQRRSRTSSSNSRVTSGVTARLVWLAGSGQHGAGQSSSPEPDLTPTTRLLFYLLHRVIATHAVQMHLEDPLPWHALS